MIRIVSDSATLYSKKEGIKNDIDIASLIVTINDKSYKELEEINTEEFVNIIKEGYIPVSSQPSIGEVVDIYEKYPEDEIINITIADGLSGTYNSACSARNMVDNPERISVLNSATLCGPQRYVVDLARKLVEQGKSREEIIKELEENLSYTHSYLMPHDFDYLVRGGRVSSLVGKIGGLINLVPIMKLAEDSKSLVKFSTKRTIKKAIKAVCDQLIEDKVDTSYKIYISHACREDLAEQAKEIIQSNIDGIEVDIILLTPAFTTHGGPGCLAIQTVKKHKLMK